MAQPTPTAQFSELETAAYAAVKAGLSRAAQWNSLEQSAAAAGANIAQLVPAALVKRNADATRNLQTLIAAVRALEAGTAHLRRWQIANGPITWGVRKGAPNLDGLGQWQELAKPVLKFAGQALFTATAWHLSDLWGGSDKVSKESADLLIANANACQQTAQALRAAGNVPEAERVAIACMESAKAAAAPPPGIIDQVMAGAGKIAPYVAGGIGGATLAVLALLLLSRKGYKARSPAQLHKPITFRKPWTKGAAA